MSAIIRVPKAFGKYSNKSASLFIEGTHAKKEPSLLKALVDSTKNKLSISNYFYKVSFYFNHNSEICLLKILFEPCYLQILPDIAPTPITVCEKSHLLVEKYLFYLDDQ